MPKISHKILYVFLDVSSFDPKEHACSYEVPSIISFRLTMDEV